MLVRYMPSSCQKNPIFGAWFFSQTCQILKCLYYKNYCIDHNQILQGDRDPQVLTVGCPNMPQTNPRWRTEPIDQFWACWCVSTLWTVVLRIAPSWKTARQKQKNHFRFHLTQLLLLFYYFLSATCNLHRFQQPTPPMPDEVSVLKLLQLAIACTASASRQTA